MKKILLLISLVSGAINLSAADTKIDEAQKLQAASNIEEFYTIYGEISKNIEQLSPEEQSKFQENVYEPKLSALVIDEIKTKKNYTDLKALRNEFDVLPENVLLEFKNKAEALNALGAYYSDFSEDAETLKTTE